MTTLLAAVDGISYSLDLTRAASLEAHARRHAPFVLYGLFLLLICAVALLAGYRGIEFGLLSRDPNNLAGAPFYAGALSNAGVLLWWGAASAGLLGALVLRHAADRPAFELLAGAALLSGVLALDDLYMVHELAAPEYLGVPELAVLGIYGACAAWWGWRFRRTLRSWQPQVLLIALGFLAASLVIDEAAPWWPSALVWEDGAKLAGIGGWCGWVCSFSYRSLIARLFAAEQSTAVSSSALPIARTVRAGRPR